MIRLTKQAGRKLEKLQTKYQFQKLKLCKKCSCYSVLNIGKCPTCGKGLIGIERLCKSILRKRISTGTIRVLLVVCLGILYAPTINVMHYTVTAGIIYWIADLGLTAFFQKSEYYHQMKKLLRTDFRSIQAGIVSDSKLAKTDFQEGRLAAAYEKLLEISKLDYSDRVKIRCVKVLNEMVLRSEMELELEGFIPSSYDKNFTKYALEVAKINRALVTKKCIAYFIHYRDAIVIDFGMDSFLTIASSTLRMKLYILEFSAFIEEFLDYFPKERILRLCHIIHANPNVKWGSLKEATLQLVTQKYRCDPDFSRFVTSRERVLGHV
ncbi:hypothetical protein [Neobacillus sp. 19]|uniref:hypothetical protein n=1 Tax=Neobacillus sp. 19 TaxID=3394458 RepID=UPI003C2E4FC0